MEDLVGPDSAFWRRKRVLVTGHTGFKGAWLSLWLHELGAQVAGLALDPDTEPSLFRAAGVQDLVENHVGDIRDAALLRRLAAALQPDIVFHLAAQSLVRRSYTDPLETFAVNVLGTANLLDALRDAAPTRAVVIVTSDKCYANAGTGRPFREDDPLGGADPYSASKACAELVTGAMRKSYFSGAGAAAVATARAGNVIGGGDWAEDRLVPDIARAVAAGRPVQVRNPDAVRPWQHVLEPLRGYLMLAEKLCQEGTGFARAWNFGPQSADAIPVGDVVARVLGHWGLPGAWQASPEAGRPEAGYLSLDAGLAAARLGWHPKLPLAAGLEWTVAWYRAFQEGESARDLTSGQIRRYARLLEDAR